MSFLQAIKALSAKAHVLEIGSGTGQHAVYLQQACCRNLVWQTSDLESPIFAVFKRPDRRFGTRQICHHPSFLDAIGAHGPKIEFDTIYTANSFHIMDTTMPSPLV